MLKFRVNFLKILGGKFSIFLSLVVFRFFLDISYIRISTSMYDYVGYENKYTLENYLLSWLIFLFGIIPTINIVQKKDKVSMLFVFLILFSFVPTTTLIACSSYPSRYVLSTVFYWISFFFWFFLLQRVNLTTNLKSNTRTIRISKPTLSFIKNSIFWVTCISVIFISGKYTGFRLSSSIVDVYDIRFEARDFGIPAVLSYIDMASHLLLPIFLYEAIMNNQKIKIFFVSAVILLSFGIAGNKITIFLSILVVISFFLKNVIRTNTLIWFIDILLLISNTICFYTGFKVLNDLFALRTFETPAFLNYYYYDFYSTHSLEFFRQGPARLLGLHSPNPDAMYNISEYYFNRGEDALNNGLFSDAYMNLGIFGLFIFPMLIILLFKLINISSKKIPPSIFYAPAIGIIMAFLSSSLTTALLSGGLAFLIIYMYSLSIRDSYISKNVMGKKKCNYDKYKI